MTTRDKEPNMPDGSTPTPDYDQKIAGHYCGQIQPHPAHVWEPPRLLGSTTITMPRQCAGATGEIPPGPCWHDSGFEGPTGAAFRCDLLGGHEGAHQCDRGSWGGTAVWANEEPMAAWEREILASSLSIVEQESIAEQVYEAYRLGRSAPAEHLPMWHEPESRERLPQVEIRRCLDVVEAILTTRAQEAFHG